MISIQVSTDVTGGTAPYTFTFASNNTNVTFSDVTGTATSLGNDVYAAITDVMYATQGDIDTTIISCTFVDANGCSSTLSPVVVDNPCDMQSTISQNGDFVFVANTTGGSGGYVHNWSYDTGLWQLASGDVDSTDNYLSLEIIDGAVVPTSTTVAVTIVDTNGCQLYKTYTYSFCKPSITASTVALVCDTTAVSGCSSTVSQYRNFNLDRFVLPCASQVIDWTTLEFSIPTGICVINNGGGLITISSSLNSSQTKIISYSVKTTSGIRSVWGTITVTIPVCEAGRNPFGGIPQTIQLTIDDVVSDTRLLNVESRVGGTPDWSTFTITNTPSWGTVTFNGNRDIVYTITNVATTPTVPDIITWTLNDYSGGQINITDTVLRNRIALPTTVTEVICNSCGETSDPQDLLSNDTGDIDRSTVQIVLNDPEIVIVKDTDNNFTFTSLPGASFNNLNSYKVANTQGAFTASQNFFVRTACVGDSDTPTIDLTCVVSKAFNIVDQFTNTNCFGYSFAETTATAPTYTTQGGTIGGTGDVDFTSITAGRTYTFEFTCLNQGSCSPDWDDVGTLSVIHGTTPFITFGTAVDNGNGTSTYPFTYSGVGSPFAVTLNGNPASYQIGLIANNGSGTFTLYNVSGLNTCVIAATSICGTSLSDTDSSITV